MSRVRTGAAWVPAVVLVPTVLALSVGLTRTEDPARALDDALPLDPGSTWVYQVFDHGSPSGTRTRQIIGPSQLLTEEGFTPMVRLSSVYDDYPGRGPQSLDSYLQADGKQLLQHGVIFNGETTDVTPPLVAYQLPLTEGRNWSYEGMLGSNPYSFDAEVTEVGDVEVGGETFSGCSLIRTTVPLADAENGEVEEMTEWVCPGIGVVLSRDVIERDDVDVTEELISFQGARRSVVLGPVPDPAPVDTESAGGIEPSTAGFDQRRSYAVPDGVLGRDLAWTDDRDESSTMPAVSDGRSIVLGELDGMVSARDVDTGELRWQVVLDPPILVPPTISGDSVLVGDASKSLFALSPDDGSARWVHRFEDVLAAAPVATDDVIAVAVEDGSLAGLDPEDGSVEWSRDLDGRLRTDPALADDLLVLGDTSGALTAVDIDNGDVRWSADLTEGVEIGPALGDDRAYVLDGGVLAAYDLDDGALVWQARGGSVPAQALAVTDDAVVTSTDADQVVTFAADDGKVLWSTALKDLDVAPAVVGDEVLAVGNSGRLTALDLGSGRVVDTWDLPRPTAGTELDVDTPLALVDGAVVVTASANGHDIEFAYPTTDEPRPTGVSYVQSHFVFPVPIAAPPVRDGDAVYALGYDQTLYRSTGREVGIAIAEGLGTTIGLAAKDGMVVVPHGEEVWGIDGDTGKRRWKVPTGAAFLGSVPAIGDGLAFLPVREVGLIAVEVRTGDVRWLAAADGTAGTSVPLALPGGDVAYAGSGLACYDAATGAVVWALGDDLADAVSYSPIAADDDTVYAQLTGFDATSPGLEKTELVAAALRTGGVRWRYPLATGVFGIGTVTGAGVVVTNDANGLVTGLDADTGERLWTYQLASAAGGTPVVDGDLVHLIERGRVEDFSQRNFRVVTLDLRTGRFVGGYEPTSTNDAVLPLVGSGPDGELLIPNTDAIGQNVAVVEVAR